MDNARLRTPPPPARAGLNWRSILAAVPVVAAGWIAVLAVVMRLGGDAPAALVILPPDGFVGRLPADVSVVSRGPVSVTVRAERPGLVSDLYAGGAALVLPAGLTGCLPQDT